MKLNKEIEAKNKALETRKLYERANIQGVHTDEQGKRHYLKRCYSCYQDFISVRNDSLTCCNKCKTSISRVLNKGGSLVAFKFVPVAVDKEKLLGIKKKA